LVAIAVSWSASSLGAPDPQKRAVAIAREAVVRFRANDFSEAGRLFLEAFELSKRPAQLYNAAKAFEQASMPEKALELWSRYATLDGLTPKQADEAAEHIRALKEGLESAAARKAEAHGEDARAAPEPAEERTIAPPRAQVSRQEVTAVESTPEPQRESGSPMLSWLLMGAGVELMADALIVWFVAQHQLDDLDRSLRMRDPISGQILGITRDDARTRLNRINTERWVSGGLLVGGAAALGAGIVWAVLGRTTAGPEPDPIGLGISIGSGWGLIAWSQRF
jgi:hypothetical protein